MIEKKLGQRIAELRNKARLTQEELAEKSGYSTEFISLVERGVNSPSVAGLQRIADALKCEVRVLFTFST